MKNNSYFLEIGKNGNNRLLTINKIYNQKTLEFMLNSGLTPGMKILEIGGGIGIFSCFLANLVGSTGHITVIDSSQLQINYILAERNRLKIKNLSAFKCFAEDISGKLGSFDMVFCRFLLVHTENPLKIIKKMLSVLNKNGLLIIEDCIFSQSFCFPKLEAFSKRLQYIKSTFEAYNKDADFGKRLYKILSGLNLIDFKVNFSQPVLKQSHEKIIIPQFLHEIKEEVVSLNIASVEEVDHVLHSLKNFVFNPQYIATSAQVCQISARKC